MVLALSGSEVVSIDKFDAKVLRIKRAFNRSRHVIGAARDDLENHQQWMARHCNAWADDLRRHQRQPNSKRVLWALKWLALSLFLIGPIVCIALFRLIARFLPKVRGLLFDRVLWLGTLARRRRKPCSSLSRVYASNCRYTSDRSNRIPGLDGPLCTGQPAPPNVTPKFESGVLPARLVVATFVGVIIGFLVAATTPDRHGKPAEVSPNALVHADQHAPLPLGVPGARDVGSSLSSVSGFAVHAETPAEELVSLPAATIIDMMSITRPLTGADEQPEATIELLEVTPPIRKPKIKGKGKRKPPKQKQQLTLWEQLPWLRAR